MFTPRIPAHGMQSACWRLLAAIAFSYLSIGLLLRAVLWAQFGVDAGVLVSDLPRIVAVGALNDALQLPYWLFPVGLGLAVLPRRLDQAPVKLVLLMLLFAAAFGALFVAVLEYFFFDEFSARFNLVAVDYLIYPHEVLGNIYASYPVVGLTAACACLALLIAAVLWTAVGPRESEKTTFRSRWLTVLASAMTVLAVAVFARADSLVGSGNRVADQLAANGITSFFAAFHTNQLAYPDYYRTGEPATLRRRLRDDLGRGEGAFSAGAEGFARRHTAHAERLGPLNVAVLTEESFGAEFVGAYGDVRGLTPEFDRLAKQGLLFTRAYATGTRTVRGLEAITASFPPIPSESIVKRPGSERIATWGSVLRAQGYHTSFLYGGYGVFDHMNAFYSGNGFAVSDRTDIPDPAFANIWGVSDGDLFDHAIRYFDRRDATGQPFFSIVMSTSNHRPYTFPPGIPGVKPAGGGREDGIRYADYALGRFFRKARAQPWFDRTLFIVVADHGARVYGAAEIPLYSYEIPLLFLAPKHLPAGRTDTLTSQIDIAPTALGLLGLAYEAPFFGQDVLRWRGGPRVLLFNHNHTVAAMRAGDLTLLDLHREVSCERYRRIDNHSSVVGDKFTRIDCDPELVDLTTAYYQVAYELFERRTYR